MIDRILIAGYGSIGKRHLRLARGLMPKAEIRVLRHQACADIPEYANGCFSDLEDAISFAPDIAVIANPATLHLSVALPLALAGVHLLIEKPMAASLGGVAELIAACRGRNTVLMTAYNLRFLSSLRRFRELLTANRVGRVLSVRSEVGQFVPSWRPQSDYRQTVSAKAALGGGVLLELSHEIDYLRWLFGEVEWVSATLSKQSSLDIDVEDTAHLVLGFSSAGGAAPVIADLNMDFVRHDTTRVCTVIGEAGSLRWNAVSGIVEVFEQGGTAWQSLSTDQPAPDESYVAQWRHFLQCITDGGTPLVSGDDGLAVLRIIDAARRSSATCAVAHVGKEDTGVHRARETA